MAFSSVLGEAQIVINANTDKLRNGLNKAKRDVKTGTTSMSQSFSALRVGILAVSAAIVSMGAGVIRATASIETMTVSFESLLGSASAAKQLMQELQAFSATTPFQLEDIAGAARQLSAAGVAAGELTHELRFIGDIAAGANVPLNEMAAIFAKIKNKGKAFTEELLQLSDRGIPIIQVLSEKLGVTKERVFELASEGKLSFDIMRQAMIDMSSEGGVFFDQMNKQSKTLSGQWSTLKDNIVLLANAIGEILIPALNFVLSTVTKIVQALTQAVGWFKKLFAASDQPLSPATQEAIDQGFMPKPAGPGSAFSRAFGKFESKQETQEAKQGVKEVKEEVKETNDEWEKYRSNLDKSMEETKVKTKAAASTMQHSFSSAFSSIASHISGDNPILGALLGPILGAAGDALGAKVGSFFGGQSIPQRALGGPINRPTLVGERGPELFIPGQAGTVVSNANMGGGGTTVVQNINVTPDAPRVFKEQLMAHMPLIKRSAIAGVAEAQNRKGGRL
jgi:tape measure domain-containing protein